MNTHEFTTQYKNYTMAENFGNSYSGPTSSPEITSILNFDFLSFHGFLKA